MASRKNLEIYLKKFRNLNVDKNKNRYSAGKAPHKPVLLLSIILLQKNDKIDLNEIILDINLRETWAELWNILNYDKIGPIYLPMYHLKSDGFWNIKFNKDITPHQPRSLNSLRKIVNKISLEDDLIELITKPDTRNKLINSLVNGGYFSEDEKSKTVSKIEDISASFEYEEKINKMVKTEFRVDHTSLEEEFVKSRDPAFRRLVLNNYKEKCVICGLNIITSTGVSVIDAAHILPFYKFKNDDIRNGLALCKRHHWLFDQGLISINENYQIVVTDNIEKEKPKNILSKYKGNRIILPKKVEKKPSPTALKWHYHNVFYG